MQSYSHQEEDPVKLAKKEAAKPLSQRLNEQADAEVHRANQFRGCSFMGEWPGSHHLRQASLLREAALTALMAERAAAKPAKRRKKSSET